MSKSSAVTFWHCFAMPGKSLKAYFGRVVSGTDVEIRTPFYEGRSVSDVLARWLDILEPGLKRPFPAIWNFETDLAKKVGPMSIMKPLSERMDDIESYYEAISLPQEPISTRALLAVISEWDRIRGLSLRGQHATVDRMKLSTNSGSPYFSKRKSVLEETVPLRVTYDGGDNIVQHLANGQTWSSAAVLGWRGQEGGPSDDDVKQRVVWMFPFGINVHELRMYQPLIEGAQRYNLVPAWVSMDAVDYEVTKLFDTKGSSDPIVCTDFTKFDQHFNQTMQDGAYCILHSLSNNSCEDWFEHIFPIKYNIPLAYNWGELRCGHHGMGSGSGGTNADETLAHRALQYEAAQSQGALLNPHSMCLGDDGIITSWY